MHCKSEFLRMIEAYLLIARLSICTVCLNSNSFRNKVLVFGTAYRFQHLPTLRNMSH